MTPAGQAEWTPVDGRVKATGGPAEQVSRNGSGIIAYESADGRHIVYKTGEMEAPLVEAPLDGGDIRQLVSCVSTYWGFGLQGHAIYYVPCGAAERGSVQVLDMTTRRSRLWGTVPEPNTAYLWNVPVSPDGNSLLFDRWVMMRGNLWRLENLK